MHKKHPFTPESFLLLNLFIFPNLPNFPIMGLNQIFKKKKKNTAAIGNRFRKRKRYLGHHDFAEIETLS